MTPLRIGKAPARGKGCPMGAVGTGTGQGRRALLMCCAQLFPSPLAPGPGRYAKAILPIAWLGKLRIEEACEILNNVMYLKQSLLTQLTVSRVKQ